MATRRQKAGGNITSQKNGIAVKGLAELRQALLGIDDSLVDVVRVANKKAADLVVERTQPAADAVSRMASAAARTLRSGRQGEVATVRLGNNKRPFALGAEFGAYPNQPRRTRSGRIITGWNQFESWRGAKKTAGYFLWPTIRKNSDEILRTYREQLDKTLRIYFPDGRIP